ncbi:carbohydrate ABC transporter substrate-binding protein [Actinotalea sp. BY-33]|uniref:Carbohydrate ABC transporter substrate-binding protein n=1 Tax=Actinotalea soli TaxID=2819234 RepID=A0A939LRB0_9CELL|nr:ABC transporter substrate-binding protein [Actinotalea soli]MBO1752593.1 carbohydrate ABC transporter substrate-binding protein [Actinotalea soli]
MRKRTASTTAVTTSLVLALAACGGGGDEPGATQDGEIAGDITVLTQRTDIVDTVFAEYKEAFEAEYPDVSVTFEAITDYEGEVTTRMSTTDYGDVLLIPNSINPTDLPDFFEPLGTVEELSDTYRFVATEQAYGGQVYGIAITGNAQGIVYNKAVWEEAGVTEVPTSPEEFLDALEAVQEGTDAIPLYTNYADGWPLTQWEGHRGTVTADPEAANALAHTDAPWAEGEEHFVIDSLLFDAVEAGYTEPDPVTTNWEESKGLLGRGEVSAMVLGSWAIVQMQAAAENPDDIGYLPFPYQVDGTFHVNTGGDYKNGINVSSENKAAARAWIDWFADESGYATDEGGLSPRLDGPDPDTLSDFEGLDLEYIELAPAPDGEEGLVNEIDSQAQIGFWSPDYRQRIVDAARGASGESKEEIFADLNDRWAAARAAVAD